VQLLLSRGWTIERLAHAIGADRRSVYRWLSGDSRPSVEAHQRALKKLAEKQIKKSIASADLVAV
jgi:transcriptional regulator with XRE-family HTH domain